MKRAKAAAKTAIRKAAPAKAAAKPVSSKPKSGARPAAKDGPAKVGFKAASTASPKSPPKPAQRPIDLYFWPTPNGWKISIMLEECGLPYVMKPVNIGKGEQFDQAFLRLSPNNRIPAIVDPDGPGGKPISIFESGAILQYLGRKTGKLYPPDERQRVEIDQWLFWQIAGLGPMAGQAHHFRQFAPEQLHYAIDRYTNEVNRLYGVMNKRLSDREYLAGKYSIADIACWTWVVPYKMQGQNIDEFPFLKAWFARVGLRPAVQKGSRVGGELRQTAGERTDDARKILFGQRART